MFEIGRSLREARERQRLELPQVERTTRIRAKYLAALEEERFDVLPGPAYAKGFLRTYADYLGLDGPRFVDEYNTRFPPAEEAPAVQLVRVRRRRSFLDSRLIVLAFALLLALIGWQVASTEGNHDAQPVPARTSTTIPRQAAPPPASRMRTARIMLAAARGRCWLSVRLGSKTGRLVYEGMLEQGRTVRFAGTRLWIRFGAPWNLDATLNGRRAQLPVSTGNAVVTPTGLATEG